MKGRLLWGLVWTLVSVSAPALAGPPTERGGLLVLVVTPHYEGALAGLQPGDWIDTWSRAATPPDLHGAAGTFATPFDLWQVIFEQAPRGRVTVYGRRGGEERVWMIPPSRWWSIETRPALSADLVELDSKARAAVQGGNLERGLTLSERAAALLEERGDVLRAAWFDHWVAETSAQAQRWERSEAATERAVERLTVAGYLWEAALLLRWSGLDRQRNLEWEPAQLRYRRAMVFVRHTLGPSLSAAKIRLGLGAVNYAGDLAESERDFREALRLIEAFAPDSLDHAEVLSDLGEVALKRGDLAAAERWGRAALAIQEKLAPTGLDIGVTLTNLADLASLRGFLSEAEALYRRALASAEGNLPGSPTTAQNLGVLAKLALHRGNLAQAAEYLERSLQLFANTTPEFYNFSGILLTLSEIAVQRGELASAHQYLTRALVAREQLAPDGTAVAEVLLSLGHLAILRGEPAEARRHLERALAIRRQQRERNVHVAAVLSELGSLAPGSGASAAEGEARLAEAVSILTEEAPGSLAEAEAQIALGRRMMARGALAGARERFARARAIRRQLSPGSVQEADALYRLGLAEQGMGQTAAATRDLCTTIDLLDRQRRMFGGPAEARAYFEATAVPYYEACLSALLARGHRSEAFAVLERGRARAFLALLAERELRPAELPPDLAAERWQLGAAYDRLQETLHRLSPERNAAEVERLQAELTQLRDRQEALAGRVRKASSRAAALHYPQPIGLASARAVLDPGTVLLSYSVGERETILFVVESAHRPGAGLTVRTLPIGRQELRNRVDRLRRLLQSPTVADELFQRQAARLYQLLLQPAEPALRSAARILICPDGPLHALPFAALRRGGKYLAEWKTIHFAPSATAYAELRRARSPAGSPPLQPLPMAAFGAPQYPPGAQEAPGDAEVRSAVRRGLTLEPLPASREEAAGVARLFPGGQAFLGAEATEEEVKRVAPRARFLHFACHGLLDEQMPLNSGLALSIPEHPAEGQDNGILQAWEIFESLRLDAELVTLSACDTALGKDMGGEGILGLTRAFQYAGARSVLASLWSVADESTAQLMQRFYGYLRQGKSKDEALRLAQVDLIRGPEATSHPYHWAAFQLSGDWR
jgi:CHAT domain-containing protein/tetratricopeptide (TPR) repeat protein